MKIIEAKRHGEISFVQVRHADMLVTMRKAGEIVSINSKGRGSVRFAKAQAKAIHRLLNG